MPAPTRWGANQLDEFCSVAEYGLGLETITENRSRIAQAETALREQASATDSTKTTLTDQRATRQATLPKSAGRCRTISNA